MKVRFMGGGPLDGDSRDIDPSFSTYDLMVKVAPDVSVRAAYEIPPHTTKHWIHRYERAAVNEQPPTMALFRYVGMVDK